MSQVRREHRPHALLTSGSRLIVLVLVALTTATACGLGPADPRARDLPYPDACGAYGFSERRCEAVVAHAIRAANVDAQAVESIEFIPNPMCGPQPDGSTILCNRSGWEAAYVRIHLAGGSNVEQSVYCGVGSAFQLSCTETPAIPVGNPVHDGYSDTPEGATPLPAIDPAAAAEARALQVESMKIPVDHAGRYDVAVGEATIPNGILSESTFVLATPDALSVTTDPSGIWLAVRPVDPGRPPFENIYARGWIDGTEPVQVSLVFNVVDFTPGATLEVVDLVVR